MLQQKDPISSGSLSSLIESNLPSSPLLENGIKLPLLAGLGSCYLPGSCFQCSRRIAFIHGREATKYNKVAHSLQQERATRLHFKSVIGENSFLV